MPAIIIRSSIWLYLLCPVIGFFVGGTAGAFKFTILGVSLLINVIAHELGHWAMAAQCGDKHGRITIGATGGVTSYSGVFMSERQRACIVMAGPLMNILIGIIAVLLMGTASMLAQVSFCLAAFNLLPIQKLDGGQLLHIWMGKYFDYPEKAVEVISVLTGMALVAYLYFNLAPLTALVGIYLVGYLFVNKR